MDVIGVRELRRNAATIMSRVEAGEQFGVTNRGRLVARLVPISRSEVSRQSLIESGALTPAVRAENLLQVVTSSVPDCARGGLSEVLREMRGGE